MERTIDAGSLRDRLIILKFTFFPEENEWRWVEAHASAGKAQLSEKKNLFSAVGIGARDVSFTVRHRADLTLANAIRWKGPEGWEHCFIASILPLDRRYDTVRCARVELARCLAEANHAPTGAYFPGVLAEKYVGHEQLDPLAVNTTTYVLVTPKAVELKRGSIVEVDGTPYQVLLGHYLDGWKNEFEIGRTEDL